jgi:serine/threonine-protein kinase
MTEQPRPDSTVPHAPTDNHADASTSHVQPRDPETLPALGALASSSFPGPAEGRLLIEEEIARGGMGAVLRGRDTELGREVAVKVILEKHRRHPEVVQRFIEEARVAGQLQHPGVVPVYELGQLSDQRPYFTMKLVAGQTLARLLHERALSGGVALASQGALPGPMQPRSLSDLPRFLKIFEQVCQTVAYAHSRGVIHRDLKPANIMVGAFGEIQVMDWGLAKVLAEGQERPSRGALTEICTARSVRSSPGAESSRGSVTEAGTVLGTVAYMAPEQARGEIDQLDERCDVFGLGAVLCEILTGQPPFTGKPESAERKSRQGDLADAFARLECCGSDPELIALAKRCLAPEPAARPRDAGVLAAELTGYLEGVETRLRRAELERAEAQVRATEERKRRRVQLGLAGVVVLLLVVGGSGAWFVQQQRQARASEIARQQQETDASAALAMAEARLLLDQARAAPLGDVARFREALAAARKGVELARTGGASPDVQRQAAEVVELIEPEVAATQRDRALLAALLEVRGPREGPKYLKDEQGLVTALTEPSADEQFATAFRVWGLDVDATPTLAAAALLQARPKAVVIEMIAALDEWASERRRQRHGGDRVQCLVDLAQELDQAPDSRSRELRLLLNRDNLGQERALGTLALALRPVPVPFDAGWGPDRIRLRRLAAQTDVAREPVLGLLTLVRALQVAGEHREAEEMLRAAVRARPQEVVLHHALGQLLEEQKRWRDAVESHSAARALRPDLGIHLAEALREDGRTDEAAALLQVLLREQPENPHLFNRLGYQLAQQGRYAEAAAAFLEATRLQPNEPTAHSNLAAALYYQGKVKEAEAPCREALRLRPRFATAYNNLGSALHGQRKFKEAAEAFRAVLQLQPDDPTAHNNLGNALRDQGKAVEAAAAYREALRLQPNLPEAHNNLGSLLRDGGRFREAEEACREAIRLKPDFPLAHFSLGGVLRDQGKLKEAVAAYREAIRLRPDYAKAYNNLGIILRVQGDLEAAVAAHREAIRLNPGLPEAHNNLGVALCQKGKFAEGEAAYREAIRLEPDHLSAHKNLARALSDQRKFQEAEAVYRAVLRLKPDDAESHNNLGRALGEQNRAREAEAAYREALRLNPDEPTAYYNLGNALRRQNKLKEAEAVFRDVLRFAPPGDPRGQGGLGAVLCDQGKLKEAEECLRGALRIQPVYRDAHFNLGVVLRKQGKLTESAAAYREAIRLQPSEPTAHINLGLGLYDQKKFDEAEAAFREVVRLRPSDPTTHYNLGNALAAQRKLPEAEAAFREALRRQPNYPEAHCNLGLCLGDQGRFREALEELRRGHELGSQSPNWRNPSDRWVVQCERLVELDRKLPAVLAGDADPMGNTERLELAGFCQHPAKRLHATAVRFVTEAFAADPKRADDLRTQSRYNAACSAVLAATGQAEDAKNLPDRVVLSLRRQALTWLRADLALHAKMAERDEARKAVQQRLMHWQKDPDLAGVRDPEALKSLPDGERAACAELWAEVAALLKKMELK